MIPETHRILGMINFSVRKRRSIKDSLSFLTVKLLDLVICNWLVYNTVAPER
jgi:hypothetical protein